MSDAATRCVFVHVRAGDAGLGLGTGGRRHPYYLARENGAELAIRFMADGDGRPPAERHTDIPVFAKHAIRRVVYRNTVAYFARLPDGNPEGTGYAATGSQSLKRLAEGAIGTMTAIDGSADYFGWRDLVATLRALIVGESEGLVPDLHVPELDAARSPSDHADHAFTARAVLDAAKDLPARIVHHVGYAAREAAENLTGADRDLKCAVYAVTVAGVLALDHSADWRHYDALYAGRDLSRREERGAA
ncbi:MAG: hypothetical protein ACTHLO_18330 [Pseudolabrys sp.]